MAHRASRASLCAGDAEQNQLCFVPLRRMIPACCIAPHLPPICWWRPLPGQLVGREAYCVDAVRRAATAVPTRGVRAALLCCRAPRPVSDAREARNRNHNRGTFDGRLQVGDAEVAPVAGDAGTLLTRGF